MDGQCNDAVKNVLSHRCCSVDTSKACSVLPKFFQLKSLQSAYLL